MTWKRFIYQHYNEYSNPLSIGWLILVIAFSVSAIISPIKHGEGCIMASVCYLFCLMDKGFGEP